MIRTTSCSIESSPSAELDPGLKPCKLEKPDALFLMEPAQTDRVEYGIQDYPDDLLRLVFAQLSDRECAKISDVSKTFRRIAYCEKHRVGQFVSTLLKARPGVHTVDGDTAYRLQSWFSYFPQNSPRMIVLSTSSSLKTEASEHAVSTFAAPLEERRITQAFALESGTARSAAIAQLAISAHRFPPNLQARLVRAALALEDVSERMQY